VISPQHRSPDDPEDNRSSEALAHDDCPLGHRSWRSGDFSVYFAELLHPDLRDESEVRLLLRHAPLSRRSAIVDQLQISLQHLREALSRLEIAASRGVILKDAKSESWMAEEALLERKLTWALDEYDWLS
jgi:hypothetical protein